MKTKLQATFDLVFREIDRFNEGCDPDSSIQQFLSDQGEQITIHAEDKEQLIKKICDRFNVKADLLMLNSCGEVGRLDVQTYTKGNKGIKCTYKSYETQFKNSKCNLWLNTFVGEVVTMPEKFDLS